MLDLTQELSVLQLLPMAAETATTTGTGVSVDTLNTGDLDACSLMINAIAGWGTVTVQLQQSATLNGTYVNIPPTPMMPNTAFPAVAANQTVPVVIPIDPRGIGAYVRAVATMAGITANSAAANSATLPKQRWMR